MGSSGSSRAHPDNPLWVCCCCGCLPFLGLAKAVLYAPLPILLVVASATGTALVCLPHDVYLSFKTLWGYAAIGPNVRALGLLLLPACLLAWPFLVCTGALLCATAYFSLTLAASVWDDGVPLLGGCGGALAEARDWSADFWRFNTRSVFTIVRELRGIPLGWDGAVFDIPLRDVGVGVGLGVWGAALGLGGAALIGAAKFVPLLCVAVRYYVEAALECEVWWWLFALLGLLLLLTLSPAALACAVAAGLLAGPACAYEALASDSVVSGALEVFRGLREADLRTWEAVADTFGCPPSGVSCVPAVAARAPRRPTGEPRGSAELAPVWAAYFERCERVARGALADGLLGAEAVRARKQGVLAAASVQLLLASAQMQPDGDGGASARRARLLWTEQGEGGGTHACDAHTRPRGGIPDRLWPPLARLAQHVGRCAPLSPSEHAALRRVLLTATEPAAHGAALAQAGVAEGARVALLRELCAQAAELALDLLRLVVVIQRLETCLARAAAGADAPAGAAEPAATDTTGAAAAVGTVTVGVTLPADRIPELAAGSAAADDFCA